MEGTTPPSRQVPRPLLAWLALLPILLIVFYPAFEGSFLLDDSSGIENNSEIRQVTVSNLLKLVRGHANVRAIDHHPVSALSMMFDYQWAGLDPFAFHISNLIYHWLAAGAVMLLFLTIWRIRTTSDGFWMAASLMFVWAVHPLATMPVSYITCRQETLLVLFYVMSIISFLRGWMLASYGFAIASFLCKEVAVTLPGAIYLADWARGNLSLIATLRQKWRYYSILTATWLLICFYHLRGGRSHEIFTAGMPLGTMPAYFKAQCGVIVGYAGKMFWPAKLQFYPYVRAVENWTEWVPALIGLLAYVALALYSLRWSRWLFVVLLFPLLVLSPTSSALPIPFEPAMEYRFYLPSVALLALMIVFLWTKVSNPAVRIGLVALVMLPLAIRSHVRTRDYKTALKLYEKDIEIDSRSLNALEALGGIYLGEKRFEQSIEQSWRLIDLAMAENNKDFASRGFNNLGLVETSRKNYPAAKDYFQRAISLNGNFGARLNLAVVHVQLSELEAGDKLLNEYLSYAPDHPSALLMSYEVRMSSNRIDEAEKVLDRFMALYPERTDMASQRTRILIQRRQLRDKL